MTLKSARLLLRFAYPLIYFTLERFHSPLYNLLNFALIIKSLECVPWKLVVTAHQVMIIKLAFCRLATHKLLDNFYALNYDIFKDSLPLNKVRLVTFKLSDCLDVWVVN